ncbi:MAG: transcriptional regulator-like protein [Moraxellaceae bacterium]|jgi:predicted DNA-binding transcriptional regulator YafY|nr:transcriptional regulator-like protein [Moraxellaceae bacterium]
MTGPMAPPKNKKPMPTQPVAPASRPSRGSAKKASAPGTPAKAAASATAAKKRPAAPANTPANATATRRPAPAKAAAKTSPKADGISLALRYIDMLAMIPRYPEKVTTSQIDQRMEIQGYKVNRRTIERNIKELSQAFGIQCFDDSKPHGWAWPTDARQRMAPAMNQAEALTLLMVKRHLVQMLPTLVVEALKPQFEQAEQRLNGVLSHQQLSSWQKKILAVPPTQPLQSPVTPRNIRDVVYSALALNARFQGSYRLKDGTLRKDHVFNPLGLVIRGHVTYLVATVFDYDDVRLYALHRFQKTTLLEDEAGRTIPGFDLDSYVHEQQGLDFPGEHGLIDLDVTFFEGAGLHLAESPLADKQVITPIAAGQHRIQARLRETEQLLWWLLGFGANVRVDGPVHLRERMHHAARGMLARYS